MTGMTPDALMEQAQAATDLSDFGASGFRQGLDLLVADIAADRDRPAAFVARNHAMIVKYLADRLAVVNAVKQRPDVLAAPVRAPVFVFGVPRTGTTLLSNLLAADPARRSALQWELDNPVPPPTSEALFTDPRCLAALDAERKLLAEHPGANRIYRMSAVFPFECVSIFAHDFRTVMLESWGKLPAFRDFLFSPEGTPDYAYHKAWLQLHQADAPGIWNLKMPSHALHLDTLLAIYPDARLIWTHRDPYTATSSFCSIISQGHLNFAGRVDHGWIGENCLFQATEHVRRIEDFRARHGQDRVIDIHYADLMRDPMATMRGLYAQLGDEFTPEAVGAMAGWLSDNPQGKFGRHEYKLAEYGLSLDRLRPHFEDYIARHHVEREG